MSLVDRLKDYFRGLGSSEGSHSGPRPGQGAVVHHSSGNADFDGRQESDARSPKRSSDSRLFPAERTAELSRSSRD